MNKNVKIILGIGIGAGLIYLAYRYLNKGKVEGATDSTQENIVYDKKNREVILVENENV
jgi:hypothetical protein